MEIVTNNQKAKALLILCAYKNGMTEKEIKYFDNMTKQNYITRSEKLDFQSNDYYTMAFNSGII